MFSFMAFDEDAPDDAVIFEQGLPKGASKPRDRGELAMWGQYLAQAAASLVVHWKSRRLERAALAYALRWDGQSELARQVDRAFDYYAAWLSEVTETYRALGSRAPSEEERANAEGLELLRATFAGHLAELRSRVQFLQARAADIRISGKLEEVADALLQLERDRLADVVWKVLDAQMKQPDRPSSSFASDLAGIESAYPEVARASGTELKELGLAVTRRAGERGPSVREWIMAKAMPMLGAAAGQVGIGVVGNAAYAWLVRMLG